MSTEDIFQKFSLTLVVRTVINKFGPCSLTSSKLPYIVPFLSARGRSHMEVHSTRPIGLPSPHFWDLWFSKLMFQLRVQSGTEKNINLL